VFLWLLFLFSVNAVQAEVICDPDCFISFQFKSGGSIVAHSSMKFIYATGSSITLGPAGIINSAVQPASLDFSAGGELNLSAGRVLHLEFSFFSIWQNAVIWKRMILRS